MTDSRYRPEADISVSSEVARRVCDPPPGTGFCDFRRYLLDSRLGVATVVVLMSAQANVWADAVLATVGVSAAAVGAFFLQSIGESSAVTVSNTACLPP